MKVRWVVTVAVACGVVVWGVAEFCSLSSRMSDLRGELARSEERGRENERALTVQAQSQKGEFHRVHQWLDNLTVALREQSEALQHNLEQARLQEAQTHEKQDALHSKTLAELQALKRYAEENIDALRKRTERDLAGLYKDILDPSVQVSCKGSTGGGVILYTAEEKEALAKAEQNPPETYFFSLSPILMAVNKTAQQTEIVRIKPAEPPAPKIYYAAYILTAHHILEKAIQSENGIETRDPVTVKVYYSPKREEGRSTLTLEGEIVSYDPKRDVALLKVRSKRAFGSVAHGARREKLRAIKVFQPVYVVGCPLGLPPIPTQGEISSLHKEVDGEKFWMTNAPTIFGNSGGGVFDRETHELIGMSNMVATYEKILSMPVPHLSIITPLETAYDWLDSQHLEFVYDTAFTKKMCDASRAEARRKTPDLVKATWEK